MKAIDVHAHFGKWFFPIEADSVAALLDMMARNDIAKAVLSSALAIIYDFREGNAAMARAVAESSSLYGYLFLNPNYVRASLLEMERYLGANPKFVGLKLYSGGYIGDQLLDCPGHRVFLTELQRKYPRVNCVLFHTYSCVEARQLLEIARAFPGLNFIMGHMGGTEWPTAVGIVAEAPNIYLELCSGNQARGLIETGVATVGARRVVFGSDMTLLNPAWTLGAIASAEIPDAEKACIVHDNAARLFGF